VLVRNDVVQILRLAAAKQSLSQTDLARMLQRYDEHRWFLAHLASLLFPWTSPYFPDHIALHAQFFNASCGIVPSSSQPLTGISQLTALILTLRQILNCTLLIEVMYFGDGDLSPRP
jgi:alpha 1,3-mannosyltransferase